MNNALKDKCAIVGIGEVDYPTEFDGSRTRLALEVIVKAAPQRVAEVPIQFRERLHGESKLSLKEQVNYLRHLLKLLRFKYEAAYQFILFAVIGSSGMVVAVSYTHLRAHET